MIQLGDIVKFKQDHHLSELIPGLCIVDDIRKFQLNTKRPNSYHIRTLNKDSNGSHSMTWVEEDEVISVYEIRQQKLNELGI